MQSTVFDFAFRLKRVDDQFYILDSKYNILKFDFKTYIIKDPSSDFSLTSSIRYENDGITEYQNIDEYCLENASNQCKGRFYINGVFAYMNMFALEVDEGFEYKPEYLLRDSNYYDVLIGRLFIGGVFYHNQLRKLIRGHNFPGLTNALMKPIASRISTFTEATMVSNYRVGTSFQEEPWTIKTGLITATLIGGNNYYLKTIENTIKRDILVFFEKTTLNSIVVKGMSISVVNDVLFLGPVYSGTDFSVSFSDGHIDELNDFICKYGIMSVNRNLVTLMDYNSSPSRITANKGEF